MGENTDLSKQLRDIRISKNLSQERFGKKIGKSGKTISAYESGRISPTLKVLDSISQVYDVTFLYVKKNKREQLKEKLEYLKKTISDIESTFLSERENEDI
ncbi:MAG TPA: helix-turn-helix transcriptional regulator [bacterium]|jgi:repressor LexA|nr:helix-turn-helix transcriptional regulator [bacterium]HOV97501.1 helix-turn-helix transcriptional regulator [bacterium]HQG58234.1 helix-turn-helix transcriptional regulator [bacterium]HQG78771.1 helix-turn-helix transcriptional regulator [bacterium]HQK41430.1 helix-turn-helix transcriptional regulator [bacterium]